jgi:hypothetical protein
MRVVWQLRPLQNPFRGDVEWVIGLCSLPCMGLTVLILHRPSAAFFEPRFAEATKVGGQMIKAILDASARPKKGGR